MAENMLPEEYNYSKKQILFGIISIFAVYSCMSYSAQTMGIARPKMAAELNGMSLYAWAISIPALFGAFATLIFGKFSDIHGRRTMLMITLAISVVGAILCAISPNYIFLIVASVIGRIGSGAMMPLTFSVVGDLFPPAQRGKWIGLLNIPVGVFSLIGPTLGGWFVDHLSWRYLYWMSLPLLVVCLFTVPIGVPSIRNAARGKIDIRGCILVGIAASATIIGFSFAGDRYPWSSPQVIGLLGTALIFWTLFLRAETSASEPILDPQVFRNRSFLTVALASLLSGFGQMGMLMYFVMFLQGVQGISAMRSGQIITPMSVLMAFISVPVGFLLGRTRSFKWMYVLGYGILTTVMFGIILLHEASPVWCSVLAAVLAGAGLGALPPINTMVVQNAVPKRLLGVAMGAFFFSMMMGAAIAPAVLGSAMNASYNQTLETTLSNELKIENFPATAKDPRVLLLQTEMDALEATFAAGEQSALFPRIVEAIRNSMTIGIRSVFWICAVTMLLAFLLICTVPRNSLDDTPPDPSADRT